MVENTALPNSRWYTGSGLYRHVYLLEGEQTYLGPWSVFVQTPTLDNIHVDAVITNTGGEKEHTIVLKILDQEREEIARTEQQLMCQRGDRMQF